MLKILASAWPPSLTFPLFEAPSGVNVLETGEMLKLQALEGKPDANIQTRYLLLSPSFSPPSPLFDILSISLSLSLFIPL